MCWADSTNPHQPAKAKTYNPRAPRHCSDPRCYPAPMRPQILLSLLLTAIVVALPLCAQAPPNAAEARMIATVDASTPASIALLEQLVNINSGTLNLPGVVAVKDV